VFTLGAAFFIYEVMESSGFNGAICVLVFSLILGNYKYFLKWMKDAKTLLPVEKDILKLEDVNVQITFLVRTLFFFFIGFIFDVSIVRKEVLIFAFVFVGVLLVSRLLASGLLAGVDRRFGKSIPIFTIMTASGFIDTLYGVLAARAGVNIPNLTEIILLMVVLTTIISLIGMLVLEKFYVNKPTY
jgi:cell volume regulation protein A